MATKRPETNKKRAPRKGVEGLDRVLFVRTNQKLLDELERIRAQRSAENPGLVLSTADIARSMLWSAIARAEKKDE